MRSTNPAAQVTPVVIIPEGQASGSTSVTTLPVPATQTNSILAQAGAITLPADFEVDPSTQVQLGNLTVTPDSTLGGRTLQGMVTLSSAAQGGGVTLQIASDNAAVRPPALVSIPFNQSSATFSIATVAVTIEQDATLVATAGRSSVTAKVKVLPVLSLSLDSSAVTGGTTVTGSITLGDPAPAGGATIQLATTDGAAASVPVLTTIATGQNSGTFSITTFAVGSPRIVTISATYMGLKQSVPLTVNPQPAVALSSVSISPNPIPGGQTTQGTVTLTAPAGLAGVTVSLQSSSPTTAMIVPASVTVPQGQTTAIFTVTTTPVPVAQTVTITASAGGVTKTASLTVQ
jgi:hypothetical protein